MNVGIYRYGDSFNFYTGTEVQPDVISIFIKLQNNKPLVHSLQAQVNWIDYIPVASTFAAIPRIYNAASKIFQAGLKMDVPQQMEAWNALKNLCRGLAAAIPVAGNIILIIHDAIRISILYSTVDEQVKNKQNIVGVALDGKVIFTESLDHLKASFPSIQSQIPPTEGIDDILYLATLKYLCIDLLKTYSERNGSQEKISVIFNRIPIVLARRAT